MIRSYGVEGLQSMIREHLRLAKTLSQQIEAEENFVLMAPVPLNTVCFRYSPPGMSDEETNRLNEKINHTLNDTGSIYLTHTSVDGMYVLRMVTAQTGVTEGHVQKAWEMIKECALTLSAKDGTVDID